MKICFVMVKILEICSSQYSVKLFDIGMLLFQKYESLKKAIKHLGHFSCIHNSHKNSFACLNYWNSLPIKMKNIITMVATRLCKREDIQHWASQAVSFVFSRPLLVTNYIIAPLYSGSIFYMLSLYDAITYNYG